MFKHLAFLFLMTSCALFQKAPSLTQMDHEKLLNAVRLTGEGKGRLSFGKNQYVFSVDSVLKDNHDWILAVAIPLHGEEVMVLSDLKQKSSPSEGSESFEKRINTEIKRLRLNKILPGNQFMEELRSLVRFILSPHWGGVRNCQPEQMEFVCTFEGDVFRLEVTPKEFTISRSLDRGSRLQLVSRNLTESIFKRSEIRLFLKDKDIEQKTSPFSLELFW